MIFPPFLQECAWAMVKFSPQPSQWEGRLRRGKAACNRMLSWNSISPSVLPLMVEGTADKNEPVLHRRSIARRLCGRGSVSRTHRRASSAASTRIAAEKNDSKDTCYDSSQKILTFLGLPESSVSTLVCLPHNLVDSS